MYRFTRHIANTTKRLKVGVIFAACIGLSCAAEPKAKAVIQIWLWGGLSHLDTFDPKPDAGYAYCGPLKAPIPTNVPGIQIGELLPELAKQADKYSIIRGMTHGTNAHEPMRWPTRSGRCPPT